QKVNEDTQKLQIEAKTQSMNEKKMWFDYFSQQGILQKTGMDIAMQLGQAMSSFINADSQRDVKHLEGEEVRRSSRASYYSTEANVERSFKEALEYFFDVLKNIILALLDIRVDTMSMVNRGFH